MSHFGISLTRMTETADSIDQVYKTKLCKGDYLLVKTCNSIYTIRVMEGGSFIASGGWFDRKGFSPMTVRINGCTWGGSAIKINVAAAKGLCLEFGNRLRTSPIQMFALLPSSSLN